MSTKLKIYGHFVSQPTRAVLWTLAMKKLPYEFIKVDPTRGENNADAFLTKFPAGVIPALEEPQSGFKLSESHAILTYLAVKHGWKDLYPYDDLQKKSEVDQWLHWHHTNLRFITLFLFRPCMQTALGIGKFDLKKEIAKGRRVLDDALLVMNYGGGLKEKKRKYLCSNDGPTLADIVAYCELDQLPILGDGVYPDLKSPKNVEIVNWMERMKALPEHDNVRRSLHKMGQLLQPVVSKL